MLRCNGLIRHVPIPVFPRLLPALTPICFLVATFVSVAPSARAQQSRTFADLSIEELLNESVTSVGRKETKLSEAAAAITLISQEDIRRSGHTSLPELLRLVPGMHVARIHGNEWAVSTRGFVDQYANKLLVLIDGRSVYTPMFGGVYWNAQDLLIEDLDRIEAIRGPGATLWGANAVNGVVNITSKSAKDTQGGLLVSSTGTEDQASAAVRYGGQVGSDLHYRVYVKTFDRKGFADGHGDEAEQDSWKMTRVGSRLDWEPNPADIFTLQGEYYRGKVGEHFDGVSLTPPFTNHQRLLHINFGGNILGRWTHHFSDVSELSIQAYFDRFHQGDGDIAESRSTADLDVQHRFAVGGRHDIVWGFGSRYSEDRLASTFYLSFDPDRVRDWTHNAFVQDEVTLLPDRLKLTIGSKFERNEHTGFEVQPSIRLVWMPSDQQTVWAALSHAVRVPSRYDRNARLNTAVFQPPESLPVLVSLISQPNAQPEELDALEIGYRTELHQRVSVEVTGFYNHYDQIFGYVSGSMLSENTPAPPHLLLPLYFRNVISGETYGAETAIQWRVSERWRLSASHSWLHMRMTPDESHEVQNPEHQYQLRSYFDLPKNFELNASAAYVRGIEVPLDNSQVRLDSTLRVDLGVTWKPTQALELGVWGQNLLEPAHAEFGSFKTNQLTHIPRSFLGKVTWSF